MTYSSRNIVRLAGLVGAFVTVTGCSSSSSKTTEDLSTTTHDMASSTSEDLSAATGGDIKIVAPYNMPGMVYCYDSSPCSTSSGTPVCCDAESDGGFADTCVASANACTALSATAHAYQCGQAADCGSGMVCCGTITMSTSGTSHLTATTCAASCDSTQTQLCVTASECTTSGAQCAGESLTGRAVGVCQ